MILGVVEEHRVQAAGAQPEAGAQVFQGLPAVGEGPQERQEREGPPRFGISDLRFAQIRRDRPLLERAKTAAAEVGSLPGPLQDDVDALFAEVSDLL